MRLTSKQIELLEAELLSDDPWACHVGEVGLEMSFAYPTAHIGEGRYNEYLITCFLLLLEAHDFAS
jgi:hypothetical protein